METVKRKPDYHYQKFQRPGQQIIIFCELLRRKIFRISVFVITANTHSINYKMV